MQQNSLIQLCQIKSKLLLCKTLKVKREGFLILTFDHHVGHDTQIIYMQKVAANKKL